MQKITVLGAGAFGFVMAKLIAENHTDKEIFVYDVDEAVIDHLHSTKKHPTFHEGVSLPEHTVIVKDVSAAVKDADLIILAIPSKFLRSAVQGFKQHLTKHTVFLNLAKGLEQGTNKRVSEILADELVGQSYDIGSLSGGMIAREVSLEYPLCADIAFVDRDVAKKVAKMLWSDYLHIETTSDLVGVELAGAFKNVVAIGAGMFDGLGFAESSKSAFVSAAAKEMSELAVKLGAHYSTFGQGGQAWFGDLMTTCFGKSRNRAFGEALAKSHDVQVALEQMKKENKLVEGYITAKVVKELAEKHGMNAPLLNGIYSVLYSGKDPKVFIKEFITLW